MKIDYVNMPKGASKFSFTLRFFFNELRTWYLFQLKFPWVNYNGFVRVMSNTRFAKRVICIGDRVQFGKYCSVATDVEFGSNILIASHVSFVGRNDHMTDVVGQYIWDGERGNDKIIVIEDDVWIGFGSIIIAGVTIGKGSVVAAGSVVNKSIPPCEVWGGVPAKRIRGRFKNDVEMEQHIQFLSKRKSLNN